MENRILEMPFSHILGADYDRLSQYRLCDLVNGYSPLKLFCSRKHCAELDKYFSDSEIILDESERKDIIAYMRREKKEKSSFYSLYSSRHGLQRPDDYFLQYFDADAKNPNPVGWLVLVLPDGTVKHESDRLRQYRNAKRHCGSYYKADGTLIFSIIFRAEKKRFEAYNIDATENKTPLHSSELLKKIDAVFVKHRQTR